MANQNTGDLTLLTGANVDQANDRFYIWDNGEAGAARSKAIVPSQARIGILPAMSGNALKVLRVNAGETDYELATPASGGGIVLQSNKVIDTTVRSTTSTTYVASNIEVALLNNLKDTGSRVRIFVAFLAGASTTSTGEYTLFSWDGSTETDLTPATMTGMANRYTNGLTYSDMVNFMFEHTPGSTTPLTYRLKFKSDVGTRTQYIGRRGNDTVFLNPTVMIVEELD